MDVDKESDHDLYHSGKSATIRESNHYMARVYVRSIMRSTMYQKAPFCSPGMAQ